MRKIFFPVILFFVLLGTIGLVQNKKAPTQRSSEASTSPTLKQENLIKPIFLSIPKLNLKNITIEHVGLDTEGKMDVPKNADNVAWFELGYLPGASGSSVIAGHFDKKNGEPAVFFKLNKLETGDEIKLENETGEKKTFRVSEKRLYPLSEFPTELIFGKADKKILNLITCEGTWNPSKKSYSKRLVVFSELVE